MKQLIAASLVVCGVLSAQTPAQERKENANRTAAGLTPIYRVTVTERTTKSISYRNRSGATKIDFGGTPLMPAAHGEAKVEGKKGYIEIEVEFRHLFSVVKDNHDSVVKCTRRTAARKRCICSAELVLGLENRENRPKWFNQVWSYDRLRSGFLKPLRPATARCHRL